MSYFKNIYVFVCFVEFSKLLKEFTFFDSVNENLN